MLIYSLLFSALTAQAYPGVTCNISETNTTKTEQRLFHPLTDNGHQMTTFKTAANEGFVAVSRGYLAVNVVNSKTKAVTNFHGYILDGKVVGGAVRDPDSNAWIEISCQLGQ